MVKKKLKIDVLTAVAPLKWDNIIPDIFLEALTFESSFTDKVINTLNNNY